MVRKGFVMKLCRGHEEEYYARHRKIWPELSELLKRKGISGYSIFLNPETNDLFSCLTVSDDKKLDELPLEPIMQKWWNYMSDIMEVNEDNSPRTITLKEVFYMS